MIVVKYLPHSGWREHRECSSTSYSTSRQIGLSDFRIFWIVTLYCTFPLKINTVFLNWFHFHVFISSEKKKNKSWGLSTSVLLCFVASTKLKNTWRLLSEVLESIKTEEVHTSLNTKQAELRSMRNALEVHRRGINILTREKRLGM